MVNEWQSLKGKDAAAPAVDDAMAQFAAPPADDFVLPF
jgi:hypothetical protein